MEPTNAALMEKLERIEIILAQMNRERFAEQYLDMEELCRYLKITRKTAHTWRKNGVLPSFKLGRRIYFKNEDITILCDTEYKKQNHKLLNELVKKNARSNGWDLKVYGKNEN
jgi:excisionase family DNA binding protein